MNAQLDKVDQMTDSAVDAVDSVDTAVRAVSMAITRPVQKVSGLVAGASPRRRRRSRHAASWREAVRTGKEAAAGASRTSRTSFARRQT